MYTKFFFFPDVQVDQIFGDFTQKPNGTSLRNLPPPPGDNVVVDIMMSDVRSEKTR